MGFSFAERRARLEEEGILIGGWSMRNIITPKKKDGKHDSSEDRVQNATLAAPDWTNEEERALLWKLDLRVLLPCCIIYFLAYLDRGNLGNVKILGAGTPASLENSLHLKGTDFNWAVAITYFAVTAALLPSNLIMKKVSAKTFFPVVMIGWAIVVMCIAGVENSAGLLVARFMLGIPEAGVVPACIMYFSMWYKPSERGFRIAIFHSSNAVASAVSAFLASVIGRLEGKGGLHAWQWVFIIEGALPIILAPALYFVLLTFPETTPALSNRERFIAINRLGRGADRQTDVTWSWPGFVRIFTRPSTYVFFTAYISACTVAVAQATFLPTILHVFLKFDTVKSNIYTALTFIFVIPLYWFVGMHSDWTRDRMWHFILPMVCCIPGYAVWLYVSLYPEAKGTSISTLSLYGMAFLGEMCRVAEPVVLSYRSSTLYGATEQAVCGATAVASLSIASILGSQMYPNSDAPLFISGFAGTVAVLSIGILSYATLPLWLMWEANGRKKKTGHSMPLQALEDEENSHVSAAAHARIHELNRAQEREAIEIEQMKVELAERGVAAHVEIKN
ncbi:hypothetical protein V500_01249 [Pseudogymnoascus sp. VKM F-4518 (FW-2643)]|nr:hypothetical protein V500_01249 [Pseudogymnoascus sp. VKM F-4518 (FW-2643)]